MSPVAKLCRLSSSEPTMSRIPSSWAYIAGGKEEFSDGETSR